MPVGESQSFDLSEIPLYEKRRFVPQEACLTDKGVTIPLYEKLLSREIHSAEDLTQWLQDRSELEAAFDQAGTILHIRMTCQTDDRERANAYKNFIEEVVPLIRPLTDQLNKKYLSESKRFQLDENVFVVYTRGIRNDVEIYREENVSLQTRIELLSQEYQTICGGMTVMFRGKERTLPEMAKFLLEPDRGLREEAWRLTAERRLKDKDRLDELFDKMLALRHQIALNAGFQNFSHYQFSAYHRFDYSPLQCKQYHSTVERLVVPVLEKMFEKRKEMMGIETLRPWDLAVDPSGKPPLKPFFEVNELIDGVQKIFAQLHPDLGKQFQSLKNLGLLDLASRKGKAPGGYQSTLTEIRKPFIFMNAVGVDQDVRTLLHEGGHAFHALAAAGQFLYSYRHAPMEFCEVASMTMELLANDYLGVFYNADDLDRSRFSHLEDVIEILGWVATVDCFQFWIYENPTHSRIERMNAWLDIRKRFGGSVVDWSGLNDVHAYLWHRQLHIFEVPFYYIEYGIAQLGALQLWLRYQKDPSALNDYLKALSLGGSRPLTELFGSAGISFDFSEKIIAPLMKAVRGRLEDL